MHLCPPPEHIMPPDLVTKVQERVEKVAWQLGLSGLASLHGYINADTGELKVMDVDTSPPLHSASPLYAQVRQLDGNSRSTENRQQAAMPLSPRLPHYFIERQDFSDRAVAAKHCLWKSNDAPYRYRLST